VSAVYDLGTDHQVMPATDVYAVTNSWQAHQACDADDRTKWEHRRELAARLEVRAD